MSFALPPLRLCLYLALALFSFILFALSAARLHYTTNLPVGDSLNGGIDFYDPVVAELLVTTLFTMIWCGLIIYIMFHRFERKNVTTFAIELGGLAVLWLFWISGAAVASSMWGNLSWCQMYEPCRVLSALVAFCWLGWLVLTALIGVTVMFAAANNAWMEPLHGRWDPRQSKFVA
ncbi:hypothetical protein AX16_000865 [Volvariella volvacea WC 439]|nr:hypothetical protein AX16_000865 [Volvariella volvacea WC 439]